MRLWSLHPKYLDSKGLVALWREALLAQAVLLNQTRGYQKHPQLTRFRACSAPAEQIASYLTAVQGEAMRRGYNFNREKIGRVREAETMTVARGQLEYEREHLRAKLKNRAPSLLEGLEGISAPEPHPLFVIVEGGVAEWEVLAGQ